MNGLLVPAEDPNALALALAQALQTEWNPHQLRQSASISWEQSAARLFDVLRRATSRA
jgi:glycosyltransferase involved in cell wall biosynthesis